MWILKNMCYLIVRVETEIFLCVNGFAKTIGIDIDERTLKITRNKLESSVILYHKNALSNVSRESFYIA